MSLEDQEIGRRRVQRFFEVYGILLGDARDGVINGLYDYQIVAEASQPPEQLPNVVLIRPFGRFGNNVWQIVQAAILARRLGIAEVDIRALRLPLLKQGMDIIQAGDLSFRVAGPEPEGRVALVGFYWEMGPFEGYARPPEETLHWYFSTFIRALFDLPAIQPTDMRTLTIHIRSGDVFGDPSSVHPGYAQPPLAYYTRVLNHARQRSELDRVLVVYEDRKNPVVNALEAHLAASDMNHSMQSGTLEEDICALIAATRLVTGPGTFAATAALLGVNTRDIYYFRFAVLWDVLADGGVAVFQVRASEKGYIEENAWANSAEQRALMLDFPERGLTLDTLSSGRDI